MEIGKLGFMGHFTAIPGVILSEAAFGGEVEESASPPPKQRKKWIRRRTSLAQNDKERLWAGDS